jgi:uncharacterized protein YggE
MLKQRTYCITLAVLLAISFSTVQAEKGNITVTGDAMVVADPEVATFTINLQVVNEDFSLIEKKHSEILEEALKLLKEAEVDEKNILTSVRNDVLLEGVSYSSSKRIYGSGGGYEGYNPRNSSGYRGTTRFKTSSSIKVLVEDLSKINKLTKLFSESKGISFGHVSYDIKDKTTLEEQALTKAIDNAKQKAKQLAGLSGLQLGKLVNITTFPSSPSYYGGGGNQKRYAPGKITTRVSVTASFEASPK